VIGGYSGQRGGREVKKGEQWLSQSRSRKNRGTKKKKGYSNGGWGFLGWGDIKKIGVARYLRERKGGPERPKRPTAEKGRAAGGN